MKYFIVIKSQHLLDMKKTQQQPPTFWMIY